MAVNPTAPKALNLRVRGFLFELRELAGRMTLRAPHLEGYGAIEADWLNDDVRRRIKGGKKQLLSKAVGLHKHPNLHILDVTAGLGRDGFTLAALGATVTMLERTPALAWLLDDARTRALAHADTHAAADRTLLIHANAHAFLASAAADGASWDVVYIDPMYPEDGKTALPSKEMQVLRDLTGGDPDADDLLALAQRCARMRVVVKRPAKAPWLAQLKPLIEVKGTQARFDIYSPFAAAGPVTKKLKPEPLDGESIAVVAPEPDRTTVVTSQFAAANDERNLD